MINAIANQYARMAFGVVRDDLEQINYIVAGEKGYDVETGEVTADDQRVVPLGVVVYSPDSREVDNTVVQPEDMWCEICAADPTVDFEPKKTDKVQRADGVKWDIIRIKWEMTRSIFMLQIRKGGASDGG
jgi:hypothetical protein